MNAITRLGALGIGAVALAAGLFMMGGAPNQGVAGAVADGQEHEVKTLGEADFGQALTSGVALVDFWAPWCGPCRTQGPIIERVAKAVGEKALVAKVNVDDNQNLARRYGVRSIPTLLLFKAGKLVKTMVGVQQERALVEAIEQTTETK
jgi:thioredoxin 1